MDAGQHRGLAERARHSDRHRLPHHLHRHRDEWDECAGAGVGDAATGGAEHPLAQPLVVQVTNALGPVSGATVDWMVVTSGGGTVSALSTTTGPSGQTQVRLILGAVADSVIARATLHGASGPGSTVDFSASSVRAVSYQSGTGQTGVVSTTLPAPLIVKVLEANGTPAVGVTVTWTPLTGGGSLSAPSTPTNGQGLAQVTWTLRQHARAHRPRAPLRPPPAPPSPSVPQQQAGSPSSI